MTGITLWLYQRYYSACVDGNYLRMTIWFHLWKATMKGDLSGEN